MRYGRALIFLVVSIASMAMAPPASLAQQSPAGVQAWFEGDLIDLAEGWGDAGACIADSAGTRCYRTRSELTAREDAYASASAATLLANCSSYLTLYSATGFGGSSLSLNLRGVGIGLAAYGFSNITSSYTIGACAAEFYDGAIGSAAYPGNTNAFASASSMATGWDNRVSTVYIF
jgi:hypothetical protein